MASTNSCFSLNQPSPSVAVAVAVLMDWSFVHKTWEKWASTSVGSSGEPLKAALLINQDPTGPSRLLSTIAEQEGIKADAIDLTEFVDFVKLNKLQPTALVLDKKPIMIARSTMGQWFNLLVCALIVLKAQAGFNVSITYVENAVAKGAVCLDGSPPAYHFDKGFGAGINNWLVHIDGGAWCNNVADCSNRRDSSHGSSKYMVKEANFTGILSNEQKFNPDFYDWNRVKVRYCDGASFTGDVEAVNPETNLHFRGARVFEAVMEDLLAKGMKNAQNAILTGCSAGGLTSILHCDNIRALFPVDTRVKCFADAGYFVNVKDVSGESHIEEFYKQVVALHGSAKHLPASCTSRLSPGLCFFPENVAGQVKTPLFIINSAYDSWQIRNILVPDNADPKGTWRRCKKDIKTCSSTQLKTMQGFRVQFLNALAGLGNSSSRGMLIDSCYTHCRTVFQEAWLSADSPVLDKTPIAKAVGDWYYDRNPFQKIDCPYPRNPLPESCF